MKKNPHLIYTLATAILFPAILYSNQGRKPEENGIKSCSSSVCSLLTAENDSSETPIAVTGFEYELGGGYFDGFAAMGAGVILHLFEPLMIGARTSIDLRDGAIFVAPFIGCSWSFGGFEIGNLFRPANAEWKVPYYESWRIWAGNIDFLYISVGVLSGVPLASIGYYEAGIGMVLKDAGHRFWAGAASTSLRKKAVGGPGLKSEWKLGDRTWLTLHGSYLFSREEDEIRYTISMGIKQKF